jgi:hypothetical protein
MQFIPFVHAFYAFESPMFYSHRNCEGKVTVIPSAMGTHQGDLLGRAPFILVHFRAIRFTISQFTSCLFSFITDDIQIVSIPFNYIICICALPNRAPCNRFFYPTSKMCNMVPSSLPLEFDTPSLFNAPLKESESWGFHWVPHSLHHLSLKNIC